MANSILLQGLLDLLLKKYDIEYDLDIYFPLMFYSQILINCTQIMKLTSAARKLYSNDGKWIQSMNELTPHDEVFVSLGEQFLNPNKLIKGY